jgi:hypothetical protein
MNQLDEIHEAMESRGFAHMVNGRGIGIILDRFENYEKALEDLKKFMSEQSDELTGESTDEREAVRTRLDAASSRLKTFLSSDFTWKPLNQ